MPDSCWTVPRATISTGLRALPGYVINVNGTLSDGSGGNVLGTVQRMFLLVAIQRRPLRTCSCIRHDPAMSGQAQVTGPHELEPEPGQLFCFQAGSSTRTAPT